MKQHHHGRRESNLGVWLVLLALAGCSNGDQPQLGMVTGTVTLDGEPLRNVEIAFQPSNGRPSYGETDDDGHYELNYIRDIMGAKVGTHKVLVRSAKVDSDKLEPVEVSAGPNVIDLECQRSTKRPPSKQPVEEE